MLIFEPTSASACTVVVCARGGAGSHYHPRRVDAGSKKVKLATPPPSPPCQLWLPLPYSWGIQVECPQLLGEQVKLAPIVLENVALARLLEPAFTEVRHPIPPYLSILDAPIISTGHPSGIYSTPSCPGVAAAVDG